MASVLLRCKNDQCVTQSTSKGMQNYYNWHKTTRITNKMIAGRHRLKLRQNDQDETKVQRHNKWSNESTQFKISLKLMLKQNALLQHSECSMDSTKEENKFSLWRTNQIVIISSCIKWSSLPSLHCLVLSECLCQLWLQQQWPVPISTVHWWLVQQVMLTGATPVYSVCTRCVFFVCMCLGSLQSGSFRLLISSPHTSIRT